jgi:hypothetical protein
LAAAARVSLGSFDVGAARATIGQLISAKASGGFSTEYLKQVNAWDEELQLLGALAKDLVDREPRSSDWALLLEYHIPRRNKYPDAIILAEDVVFIIEFKVGATAFDAAAKWQVEDYALDLRDFHLQSRGRSLFPILVATNAQAHLTPQSVQRPAQPPSVWPVICATPPELSSLLLAAFRAAHQAGADRIDPDAWDRSMYRPTLSIIEAAKELFARHSVREISHAYADNLLTTTDALVDAICTAQEKGLRTICFVTGVPGAGKTLTGLNAIHHPSVQDQRAGVFLSGNGPLVRIVRDALVRDAVAAHTSSKREAARKVGTFIQNVHSFMDEYMSRSPGEAPDEKVVVFDEAQRAWNANQAKKKGRLACSEPRAMLEVMERCLNWCVIVALVGGGQEIHNGEAGLEEWGHALSGTSKQWHVLAPREALEGGPSLAGHRLFCGSQPSTCLLREAPSLHLDVSVRSPRAQRITHWVNLVLEGRPDPAREVIRGAGEFPLVLTRDLALARRWLRDRSRFERRCGLVTSSGSIRHRAYGLEVSSGFRRAYPFEEWFLAEPDDVRSSYQLEVAATEFECQGLELDWVGLCWGGDLCVDDSRRSWHYRQLKGTTWQAIRNEGKRRYLLNKYRVLLTRAREGMVIWVPPGDPDDPTLPPGFFDATAAFLHAAGVPSLD